MAIWQYDIHLVPKKSVDPSLTLPASVTDLDLKHAWNDVEPPPDFFEVLDMILDESESWHDDLRWWGSERGDRIDVWSKDGRVTEVKFRVNLLGLDPEFIKALQIVALGCQCVLWSRESGALFRPEAEEILQRFEESNAELFLMDPERETRQQDEESEGP